ncbi:hypothetical protein PFBG_01726 [Plasmodium falciparum 7G8]|uniref:Erythrocyte membrane protein 1 n=3 Tax=Plasmodium falciparum TaxID=5833 RepID=W7FQM2_PLAF8|nr:hypothetical protein PFBG_01726 [Plasmodium falciparum 7G8]
MAPVQGGGGGNDYSDAKHLLDSIGEEVYKEKVKDDAKTYDSYLKGNLTDSSIWGKRVSSPNPCKLVEDYYNNHVNGGGAARGKRYPCTNLKGNPNEERFSNTLGGQCTNKKMRSDGIGACAPYRRLHLCHHNLETIDTKSMTTHKLLAEVCMAAKYEGETLTRQHDKHKLTNPDVNINICTELARSFADIGDIVRGKDLYLGNDKEKEKRDELEKNLKKYFQQIHDDVTSGNKGKTNVNTLKTRYKEDPEKNFFKLREDWWYANRQEIWEAITCDVKSGNNYFRPTCGGDNESPSMAKNNCRCDGKDAHQVPTYFDYVPQYLRWFEEWAEDFCRKKKHKLNDAIQKCRKPKGEEKYCDLNRHNCARTIRGDHIFVEEDDCKYCHFSCAHFVKWIDNQKLEFEKQVKKYKSEMQKYINEASVSRRRRRDVGSSGDSSNYDGYEKKFYNELKKNKYVKVGEFLDLLSKETTCTKITDEKEGTINFKTVKSSSAKNSDDSNKTFDHTEYCQACPWCGVKEQKAKGGKWEPKTETCGEGRGYSDYENTKIPILTGDKTKSDMVKKYNKFCKNNGGNGAPGATPNATSGEKGKKGDQMEKWICYYGENKGNMYVKGAINFCVLQDGNQGKPQEKSMHYNAFFWKWVYHMLHDSLDWRNELGSCINNNTNDNTCKNNKCNSDCDCFLKWVKQKENEWKLILKHFKKQGGFDEGERQGLGLTQEYVLAALLDKDLLLKSIEDTHADAKDIDRIKKMLKDEETSGASSVSGTGGANGKNSIIHKLLKHEEEIATKCKNCQPTKIRNPCSGDKTGDQRYEAVAQTVAKILQQKAHTDMLQRSGKDGESETDQKVSLLKADASQGKYIRGGSGNELQGENICNINTSYSNDSRSNTTDGACTGKDNGGERFKIGTPWKRPGELNTTYKEVYLPPRREHMCTSNLEKIDDTWVIKNANDHVNDTFLVDVLLAAKKEAEYIKKTYEGNNDVKYKDKNGLEGDQVTTCRAIKSSFADIGDIIRGRDLWVNGDSSTDIKNKLEKIFPKIKEELKNKLGDKYKDYTDNKQLRSDWWEANRDQIWKAMQCPTKNGTFPCSGVSGVPFDDYIPQRLRWMTEWAEWFCKAQAEAYGELLQKCGNCKGKKENCRNGDNDCQHCIPACTSYRDKIKKWQDQWNTMQIPYALSYWQAKNGSDGMAFGGTDPDYKQVVHFFEVLQKEYENATSGSATNSPYATPAGYIHQEARTGQCLEQNEFCEYENGVDRNTDGAKENKKYAFKHPPHGYDLACTCNTRDQQTDGRGRSADLGPQSPAPNQDNVHVDDEDEDEDDEEEEEEDVHDGGSDVGEVAEKAEEDATVEDKVDGGSPTTTPEDEVKVCKTVEEALKVDTLQKACSTKYEKGREKFPNWKCVPTTSGDQKATTSSGATTSDKGAICVPPRRRRLYVTPLTRLASGSNTVVSESPPDPTPASTSSRAQDPLLAAFVESAAVETFFLWHKYKEQWRLQKAAEREREGGLLLGVSSSGDDDDKDPENPQKKLEGGEIPEEFKRQMFYTLGDYRDILYSGSNDVTSGSKGTSNSNDIKNIVIEASGNTEEEKDKMRQIQAKITDILNNQSGNNKETGGPPKPSVEKTPQQTWWDNNAKHIWEGMICALTYKENGEKGTPQVDTTVQKALMAKLKKPDTKTGEEEGEYHYENVKLENSGTEAISNDPINNPKLTEFVEIPTFFRYLHEWGETFCRERAKRLAQIKHECMDEDGDTQKYSGDGEDCNEIDQNKDEIFKQLEKPSCAKPCSSYRKWIERKGKEFEKQKGAYIEQKKGIESNKDDNEFSRTLGTCTDVGHFLEKLKSGSCKKDSGNENRRDNEKDKLDFNEPDKTFVPAANCAPCSQFTAKLEKCNCIGASKANTCTTGKITAEDIKNKADCKEVDMRVSDSNTKGFGDLNDCADADIFTGIKEHKWKCGKVCGYNVCGLINPDGNINNKQIILVRAFLKRWLEYFLEDYNKIRKKLKSCTEKGEGSPCIKDCKKKCDCVKAWINLKTHEWKEIKKRYLDQYEKKDSDDYEVKYFLQQGPFHSLAEEAKKVVKCKGEQDKLWGCTGANLDGNEKNCKDDFITNLIDKLKKEATSCKDKHSGENQKTSCDDPPPVEDDEEDLLLEENENPVGKQQPSFCPKVDTPKPEEGGCEEAPPKEPSLPSPGGEQTPILKPEEEAPTPEKSQPKEDEKVSPRPEPRPRPKPPPRRPRAKDLSEHPAVIPSLVTSTLAWSVGIGFATFTYFYLKVLYIYINIYGCGCICIDYDIPTLKSSNRYIPYASDRHKGKTYIYMEGDSGDEKYTFMSDTSDITSSSESEYEELDINEIYPYQSPKYKTLIEVILEPSKRDIQSDDTPSNKFTDNEWNVLKNDFITNILQNEQNDIPNNNTIANIPLNTHLNTLYFDNPEEKPFITNIHDRNLYSGEEYSYNINFDVPVSTNINTTTNNNTDDTMCGKNDTYSGIDLINDSLNSDQHIDIYDEILKRKENELFGTNHTKKNTSTNSVAKNTNSDPILNQINLFHKWLDRHRNICEEWDKNKEDILNKLKEEWNKENNNNSDKTYNSHNKPSHNHVLNTDVSIQIDMNNPNTKNEITNMDTNPDKSTMDTILDDLEKYNEPYYYDFYKDDIYYDVNDDDKTSVDHINMDHNKMDNNNSDVPTKVQIEMNIVNNKKEIFEEKYPISDIWNI